jgi:hypothetical protein
MVKPAIEGPDRTALRAIDGPPLPPYRRSPENGILARRTARWLAIAAFLAAIFMQLGAKAVAKGWLRILGGPAFEEAFRQQAPRLLKSPLAADRSADDGVAGAAFANAYKASHDALYLNRAKEIADFLITNALLAGDGIPGWGPKLSIGYGFCPDADNFKGKDLWETTRALDAILKTNEITPSRAYVETARKVVENWPSEERRFANDGPYASGGMRFYRKEPDSCARKYVKNTNLAMGEVLYRLARQTGDKRYEQRGEQVLNAELWEILTRKNFGYHGAVIYVDPQEPQNQKVLKAERNKVQIDVDGKIVCRNEPPDASCWNHLAFEAYELYQIQLLSGRDLAEPIWQIMSIYRTSSLGDTLRFPWQGGDSPTHITAYNCHLRNSGKAVYRDECLRALQHNPKSSMIFYSLLPDDLVR